jgi:hypothetical protein
MLELHEARMDHRIRLYFNFRVLLYCRFDIAVHFHYQAIQWCCH